MASTDAECSKYCALQAVQLYDGVCTKYILWLAQRGCIASKKLHVVHCGLKMNFWVVTKAL